MDALELATRVAAVERRRAGSDAERRAALLLAEALRATSRRRRRTTELETFWVRPHRGFVHALCAGLAVLGSVLAVDHPALGLGVAAGALLLLVEDLLGRIRPLQRLTPERATQNVVSRDPRRARVRLVITAAVDAPSPGLLGRGRLLRAQSRLRRRLRGHLPGPYGILVLAMVALAGCALARLLGLSGTAIGAVQLVPSILALLAVGAALDQSGVNTPREGANGEASAAAVAVALVAALDADPPDGLAVDCVLAGAAGAGALGFRHWVREERATGIRPEEIAVLELAACGAGRPAFRERDGLLLPLRFHPQLRRLAAAAGLLPHESREASGARAARAARWPALVVGCVDENGVTPRLGEEADTVARLDPEAMEATLAACLRLVRALDAELSDIPEEAARRTPSAGLPRRRPVEQPSNAAWRERPPTAPPVQAPSPPATSARAARRATTPEAPRSARAERRASAGPASQDDASRLP